MVLNMMTHFYPTADALRQRGAPCPESVVGLDKDDDSKSKCAGPVAGVSIQNRTSFVVPHRVVSVGSLTGSRIVLRSHVIVVWRLLCVAAVACTTMSKVVWLMVWTAIGWLVRHCICVPHGRHWRTWSASWLRLDMKFESIPCPG